MYHRDEVGSDAQPSVHACGLVDSLAKFGSPKFRLGGCRTGCGETETVRGNQNVAEVGKEDVPGIG